MKPAKPQTFEESLTQLESIVRDLEAGDASLEESLEKYETGVGLLNRCYSLLKHAEQRVLICGEDESGKPTAEPFPDA